MEKNYIAQYNLYICQKISKLYNITNKGICQKMLIWTTFDKLKIKAYSYQTLNSPKGVIRSSDLIPCFLDKPEETKKKNVERIE